jgi:endonuclease YncB( thermonuclease family)
MAQGIDKKSPNGLLEFHGPIHFDQFYYQNGDSDADTVKVEVKVNSVRFRSSKNSPWKENLHVFDDAYIGQTKVMTKKKHTITVRLQGIDAPELHYQAQRRGLKLTDMQKKKWMNNRFRQYWSAKAIHKLEQFVKKYVKAGIIKNAYVFSRVDNPNDVFDVYGRFVGDIVISKDNDGNTSNNSNEKNINQWLVEEGWAVPTFYNSMTDEEIRILDLKGNQAMKNSKGIWKDLSSNLVSFNPKLNTPRKGSRIDHKKDKGKLNVPKIFRRQVDYEVRKKANVSSNTQSFISYLRNQKRDKCYVTTDFLGSPIDIKVRHISEFLDQNNNIKFQPGQLVFKEDASATLKNSRGKKITKWE